MVSNVSGMCSMSCRQEEIKSIDSTFRRDEKHMTVIERIEDEYYVRVDHSMTKEHYISFIAATSSDQIQIV